MSNRLIAKREKISTKPTSQNTNPIILEDILNSLAIKFQKEIFLNVPVLQEVQTFLINGKSKKIIEKNMAKIQSYGWLIVDVSRKETKKRAFMKENCVKINRLNGHVSISFLRKLFLKYGKLFNLKLVPHKTYSIGRLPADDEFFDVFVFYLSKRKAELCLSNHEMLIDQNLYSLEAPCDAEINIINEEYQYKQHLKRVGCLGVKIKEKNRIESKNNEKFCKKLNPFDNVLGHNQVQEAKMFNDGTDYKPHGWKKDNYSSRLNRLNKIDESKEIQKIISRDINNSEIYEKKRKKFGKNQKNKNIITNKPKNSSKKNLKQKKANIDNRSESVKKKMRPRLFEYMNYGNLKIHVVSKNDLTFKVSRNHHVFNIQFRNSPSKNEIIEKRLLKLNDIINSSG